MKVNKPKPIIENANVYKIALNIFPSITKYVPNVNYTY